VVIDETKIGIAIMTMTTNEIRIIIAIMTKITVDIHLLESGIGIMVVTSIENVAKNMENVHHRRVHHLVHKRTLNHFDLGSFNIKTIH
jgi:hypothetical protein